MLSFNMFINESKSNGKNILEKMSKLIKRRFKNEDRVVFTYWIGKIFNFEKYLIISGVEFSDNIKDIIHVYIKIDDEYFDGSGFHTKEDIIKNHGMSKYSFKDFTYYSKSDLIEKFLNKKEIKLNSAQIDELKHIIEKFKIKYELIK